MHLFIFQLDFKVAGSTVGLFLHCFLSLSSVSRVLINQLLVMDAAECYFDTSHCEPRRQQDDV